MDEIISQMLDNFHGIDNFLHGPEIWLGIVGLCGVGVLGIIGVCVVNSGRLREREEEMREKHERKDDL